MKRRTLCGLLSCMAALSLACSDSSGEEFPDNGNGSGNGGNGGDTEYVAPEPPANVNPDNVFRVAVCSTLSDESLFTTRDPSVVSGLIDDFDGQKPVLWLLERSDFRLGSSLPHVDIACATKSYAFFAQHEPTSRTVAGTGIVTRCYVTGFDAVWKERLKISGCRFEAPLAQPTPLTVYTARFAEKGQFETLVAERGSVLQTDGIVIGSLPTGVKAEVTEYLKHHLRNYRLVFAANEGTDYDLFALTPVGYVCRGIEAGEKVNIPYRILSLEKL